MKKFSIVLLALLLAGGFAFAADMVLNGEVVSSFAWDLEDSEIGFGLSETAGFDISWAASATSEGEGDVYAVITVEDAEALIDETGLTWTNGTASAKVVGPDWEVAFGSSTGFGNATAPDMAQDGDDTASYDGVTPTFEAGNGLTVTYSDITVGFDYYYDNDVDDDGTTGDNDLMYMVTTGYALELADSLTADAEVAVASLSGSASTDFFGTLALAYEMEGMTANAGFDMEFLTASSTLNWDASLATSYSLESVTLEVAGYYDGAFDAFAKASYAEGALEASVWGYVADNGNSSRGDAADVWEVGGDLSYAIDEVYTAYAEAGYTASATVPFKVGVEAALISNATVDLNYDTTDVGTDLGVVTASVTVEL